MKKYLTLLQFFLLLPYVEDRGEVKEKVVGKDIVPKHDVELGEQPLHQESMNNN